MLNDDHDTKLLCWALMDDDHSRKSVAVRHCITVNSQQSEIAISHRPDLGEKNEPAPTCLYCEQEQCVRRREAPIGTWMRTGTWWSTRRRHVLGDLTAPVHGFFGEIENNVTPKNVLDQLFGCSAAGIFEVDPDAFGVNPDKTSLHLVVL